MGSTFTLTNPVVLRPTDQHLFTNISHGADQYRVLTKECKQTINALVNLKIFWAIVTLIELSAILEHMGMLPQGVVIFGTAFIGVLFATVLAIIKRKNLISLLVYSLINLSLYLATCTGLLMAKQKKLLIPTLIYITLQTLLSITYLQHRHKLMPKFFIQLQLLIIILKLDSRIQSDWIEVCFGFLLTFFVTVVIVLSMLIFWGVNVLAFKERAFSVKHIGLIFVIVNAMSTGLLSMASLAESFFNLELIMIIMIAITFNLVTIAYSTKFQTEIILFMCKVEKIKAFNQLITLIKISSNITQSYVFVKKSQNWYQRLLLSEIFNRLKQNQSRISEKLKQTPQAHSKICDLTDLQGSKKEIDEHLDAKQEQDESKEQISKCLICLQLQACMVWMPCGHMTVCELCCDKILQNKCCNCLLCKNIPEAIYHIQTEQPIKQNEQKYQKYNIKSIHKFRFKSTKDLDQIQNSLSGQINESSQKSITNKQTVYRQMFNICRKGQVFKIRAAYSVKIN